MAVWSQSCKEVFVLLWCGVLSPDAGLPVFAVGNVAVDALARLLVHLGAGPNGNTHIVVTDAREELVVYVNGAHSCTVDSSAERHWLNVLDPRLVLPVIQQHLQDMGVLYSCRWWQSSIWRPIMHGTPRSRGASNWFLVIDAVLCC
jgi:hypothetical protein